MTTVEDKLNEDAQRPLALVYGSFGGSDVRTHLQDLLADTMHALEMVVRIDGDDPDPRASVLLEVERAIGHYWSESVFAILGGAEDADVLGGIPIYRTELDFPHLTDR